MEEAPKISAGFAFLKDRARKLPAIEQYMAQQEADRLYSEAVERARKEFEEP